MATQKKSTAPDWYWVVWQNEVTALVSGTSADIIWFQRLMQQFFPKPYLLDVITFCENPQPDFTDPDYASWQSGTGPFAYQTGILQALFYDFAEEV